MTAQIERLINAEQVKSHLEKKYTSDAFVVLLQMNQLDSFLMQKTKAVISTSFIYISEQSLLTLLMQYFYYKYENIQISSSLSVHFLTVITISY